MSNVWGRCKCPTSSRIAAGECNLYVHESCSICWGWTSKQWSKLWRSLVDARARASQRGKQHWTAALPQLEAWIISRPALLASSSGPASEISSLVSGDDFSDRLLVGTSSLLAQQDLVVKTVFILNVIYLYKSLKNDMLVLMLTNYYLMSLKVNLLGIDITDIKLLLQQFRSI